MGICTQPLPILTLYALEVKIEEGPRLLLSEVSALPYLNAARRPGRHSPGHRLAGEILTTSISFATRSAPSQGASGLSFFEGD